MYAPDSTDDSWQDIYDAYQDELTAFVRSRIDEPEASDLLQDIWASLAETLETQELQQPRAWLYRVARNRLTDQYRQRASRPAFTDLTSEVDAEEITTSAYQDPDEAWEEIEVALEQLPPAQREVFERNELDGETLREIAEDLGLPLKTVISRKGYARRRLQSLLQEFYEDYFGEE